jgi:hypothetical protein
MTERVWSCRQCGACCATKGMPLGPLVRDVDGGVRFGPGYTYTRADDGLLYLRKIGRRCALLGPDNRCTVYNDRPIMCRDWRCEPAALLVQYGDLATGTIPALRHRLVLARRWLAERRKRAAVRRTPRA